MWAFGVVLVVEEGAVEGVVVGDMFSVLREGREEIELNFESRELDTGLPFPL